MSVEEFLKKLDKEEKTTYIVTLAYKYDFEDQYYEENLVLEYDGTVSTDYWVWNYDWLEGQEDVKVLGYIKLQHVKTIPIGKYPYKEDKQ